MLRDERSPHRIFVAVQHVRKVAGDLMQSFVNRASSDWVRLLRLKATQEDPSGDRQIVRQHRQESTARLWPQRKKPLQCLVRCWSPKMHRAANEPRAKAIGSCESAAHRARPRFACYAFSPSSIRYVIGVRRRQACAGGANRQDATAFNVGSLSRLFEDSTIFASMACPRRSIVYSTSTRPECTCPSSSAGSIFKALMLGSHGRNGEFSSAAPVTPTIDRQAVRVACLIGCMTVELSAAVAAGWAMLLVMNCMLALSEDDCPADPFTRSWETTVAFLLISIQDDWPHQQIIVPRPLLTVSPCPSLVRKINQHKPNEAKRDCRD